MTTIAYLGVPGSFSYMAAQLAGTTDDTYIGAKTFRDIFAALADGSAEQGVVPIENSLAGSIYENYDLLDTTHMSVIGERYLRVQHSLLVHKNVTLGDNELQTIKKVYSHPKALEQCETFFAAHPHIEKQPYGDTATAARFVSEQNDPSIAAIAGPVAAKLYNLRVVKDHIEDYPNNFTRFLIVAPQVIASDDNDKCSLVVRLPHEPGSLHSLLGILADSSCNLTKLESRPWRNKPFEYVFYIDFCYDPTQSIKAILDRLRQHATDVTVLGTYKDQAASML